MVEPINSERQRGAAVVEFVLVLPLLLLVLFGIIEFSVLLYDKAVVTNASREAAREWIEYRPTKKTFAEIDNVVQNHCQDRLITFSKDDPDAPPVTIITPADPDEVDSGEMVTVRVEYTYTYLFLPGFVVDMLPTLTLRAQTVMRAE